ncbi:hypothetical protein [Pelagicoccus sp. SDUM812003]|uniref:hypothetical protein n=1 Tax=Pelagicoccus sp. SDUM812003 TaxID=3041267 RepID=UPI0028104410|nr:hypothetical protein [Pelagicoccus sp. SDUM812003]MDQ8203533.1 hypothetical protein [Pelagicoccus sp. SDUM812003]
MDFSRFQMIWDEQEKDSLFAIDRAALSELVGKAGRKARLDLRAFEYVTMLSILGIAIAVASEPFFEKHEYFQYYEAALFLAAAVAMFVRHRQRAREEARFDTSLCGEVDLTIWRLESLAMRLREYCWIALTPMILTGLVRIVFQLASKPLWLQLAWAALMVLTPIGMHKIAREKVQPQLRSMKALRETLRGGEASQ